MAYGGVRVDVIDAGVSAGAAGALSVVVDDAVNRNKRLVHALENMKVLRINSGC